MSHLVEHTGRPPVEATIVLACVSAACCYGIYVGTRTLFRHNDITLNRSKGQSLYMRHGNRTVVSRNFALKVWKSHLSIGDANEA